MRDIWKDIWGNARNTKRCERLEGIITKYEKGLMEFVQQKRYKVLEKM